MFRILLALLVFASYTVVCCPFDREVESAYMDMFSREFGYTLIGEKPASVDEFDNEYCRLHPVIQRKFLYLLQNSFKCSENFILKIFSDDTLWCVIELVNINAIKNLISNNKPLQLFIKKNYSNKAEFYKELKAPTTRLFDVLKFDNYLIGLVLGYGDTNSDYACRKVELGCYLKKYPVVSYCNCSRHIYSEGSNFSQKKNPFKKKSPKINPAFESLEEEWEWLRKIEWDLDNERKATPPYFIALPFYICRHGGDSEQVREKYVQARSTLASLFSGRTFQEVVAEVAAMPTPH